MARTARTWLFGLYLGWLVFALAIPLVSAGLDAKNLTVLGAVALLLAQLALRPWLSRLTGRVSPRALFIGLGVLGACGLEALHMISQPFDPRLLITAGMSARQALRNLGLDLLFTVPSYLIIFSVIWRLVRRYRLSGFAYSLVISLGQGLGDGGILFFVGAPFMLAFLPYTLVKYQAMNLVPYLLVRSALQPTDGSWRRFVVPVVALVATYFTCGAVMNSLWARCAW